MPLPPRRRAAAALFGAAAAGIGHCGCWAAIPVNKPVEVKQHEWCFDHQWSDDPDRLILYLCQGGQNQQFIWRQEPEWNFSQLVTVLDERCVGVAKADADKHGTPRQEAPISFLTCEEDNELLKWRFLPGEQQLQMASFPSLCMDYSDGHNSFIVYRCKTDAPSGRADNQRAVFVDSVASPIRDGVPVQVQHRKGSIFDSWAGQCLDRSRELDSLGLYACKEGPNQLWIWKSSAPPPANTSGGRRHRKLNRHLPHLTSSLDGRCIVADRARVDSPVSMKLCADAGDLGHWRYAPGLQQIRLVKWPYLCLGKFANKLQHTSGVGLVGCALDPEPHFEVVDVGRHLVEDDVPLALTQGEWCVGLDYQAKPARYVLAHCTRKINQEFVWRSGPELAYHHLQNGYDDSCAGLLPESVSGEWGQPKVGSLVTALPCNRSNELIQWSYAYGPQQIRLRSWPHLCLNFDSESHDFRMASCTLETKRWWWSSGGLDNQRMVFGSQRAVDHIPTGLPGVWRVGDVWQRRCLRRTSDDALVVSACSEKGSIDELFDVVHNKSWGYSLVRSLVDDLCVVATAPKPGAAVAVGSCGSGKGWNRWVYSHSRGYLRLAEWPRLCLHLVRASVEEDQQAVVGNCTHGDTNYSLDGLADRDEEVQFRAQGLQEVSEDVPLTIQQQSRCLDQQAGDSHVRLFDCHGSTNQRFVWHRPEGADAPWHHLISHVDNRCMGVRDEDADQSGKPWRKAPVVFKECDTDDNLTHWVYSYGRRQLQMARWLYLCMQLEEKEGYLVVQSCAIPDVSDSPEEHWLKPEQEVVFAGVAPPAVNGGSLGHVMQKGVQQAFAVPTGEARGGPGGLPGPPVLATAAAAAVALLVLAALAAMQPWRLLGRRDRAGRLSWRTSHGGGERLTPAE